MDELEAKVRAHYGLDGGTGKTKEEAEGAGETGNEE